MYTDGVCSVLMVFVLWVWMSWGYKCLGQVHCSACIAIQLPLMHAPDRGRQKTAYV